MALNLDQLRPSYNLSALGASIAPAIWWGHTLTASTTSGPLAPLGLTLAALLATGAADLKVGLWPTRALLLTPITALLVSTPALHAVLNVTTGAAL
jgi:hypothetical protein